MGRRQLKSVLPLLLVRKGNNPLSNSQMVVRHNIKKKKTDHTALLHQLKQMDKEITAY